MYTVFHVLRCMLVVSPRRLYFFNRHHNRMVSTAIQRFYELYTLAQFATMHVQHHCSAFLAKASPTHNFFKRTQQIGEEATTRESDADNVFP